MIFEDVERKVRLQPFHPFRVYMTDGSMFEVRHPEMILLGRRMAVIGVAANPEQKIFDRAVDIDLAHVVRMEFVEIPAKSNGTVPS